VRRGWELNLEHAIVITRSLYKRRFNPLGNVADLLIYSPPDDETSRGSHEMFLYLDYVYPFAMLHLFF